MLVTKREVRQASKKLLSVLLAVVMIMTSMSVCFGSVAFAAGTDVDVTALANALKFDSVKNATFSGSANDYTVSDPDGKVLAAVEAYFAAVDAMANKNPAIRTPSSGSSDIAQTGESSDKTYRTINHLNARVKTLLSDKMGSDYTDYNVDAFITGLLAGSTVSEGTTMVDGSASTSNNTTVPGTPLAAAPEVKLTVMMESAVTGHTLDSLPDSVVTSKTFTVKHANTNYDYKYDFTDGGRCDDDKYEHDYWFYYNYSSYSKEDGASKSTQTIKNTQSTLEAYVDYFSMDMDELYAVDAATLDTVSTAVKNAKANVVTGFGAGVYTHFFSAYNVEKLTGDIVIAKELQVLAPKLLKAYEDMEKGYGDIITDKAALNTLAQTMKTAMDAYDAASAAAKTYVTEAGFIRADVETFYSKVLREIELIELRELIEEITLGILPFAAYTVDSIADGSVTSADIGAALTAIAGYEGRLDKYNAADVEAVAGADFRTGITNLKQQLSYLKTVAGYEDDFSAEYEKFASEIFSVTDANGDIDTLLSALKSYDGWYTGLKALIAEMKSALGEEVAEKLFDDLNNVMTERMDDAYVALNALLEAQIDYAYDLFKAYISTYGEMVNMLTVSEYKAMQASIGLINAGAYSFLNGTDHFELSAEAVAKYEEMQKDFPEYEEFLNSKGFATYQQTFMPDLERPDTEKDIARENEDGVYKTSDEDIEAIISLLDALLQNDAVKDLLGSFINKDEEGNPTGEPFDLATLVSGLIEGMVFSDSLINTVIQFVYPAVANIFTEVWMGIDPWIDDPAMAVMGQTVSVKADLYLNTVEEATAGLGLPIFPADLAAAIRSSYSQFSAVADVLDDATTKAYIAKAPDGSWDESTRKSPWDDAVLYSENVNEETGETTKTLNLDWGIDELEGEAKRERFLQAVQAALCGLEPILLALLCNTPMERFNAFIGSGYGKDGLNGFNAGDVLFWKNVTLSDIELDIHTIDLRLNATANDGYNNVIAPLFELLGVTAPDGRSFTSSRDVIEKGLLQPLDAVIAKLAANPVATLLEILPNLAYAVEADMLLPKLNYLATNISYSAGATINADLNDCTCSVGLIGMLLPYLDSVVTDMTGLTCSGGVIQNVRSDDVMTDNLPVEIAGIINIEDLLGDVDLTSFAGIWDMLAGSVDLLAGMEAPNAGIIATLGALGTVDTKRSQADYELPAAGKAYHIEANKADVLVYLLKYVLGSGLIDGLVENPEGIVADLLTALSEKPDTVLAAVVELLNQKEYDTLREFEWFNGFVNGESVVGNSANAIYLNPENDWTEAKAEYLYKNLDALVSAILTMAGADFDLGATIDGAISGLLSDKTLTALAKLLGSIADINSLIAGEDAAEPLPVDVAALLTEFLGIDLSVYADYADIAEDEIIDFGVDAGTTTFAAALADMLEPLSAVLDFILAGENLVITVEDETVELVGYDGYNNAIIPLLEALDCDIAVNPENALEAILTALIGKIEAITKSETPIKDIIDLLPGVFYFIASKGLSVSVRNLLQPVYVILDTVRPIYDLDLNATINGLLPEDFGIMLNIDDIGIEFIFDLLKKLVPDLDLSALKDVIYDICNEIGVEYESKSTLQDDWKKGAYSESFSAADLLTVVLSFVLEWATIEDNAKALDEMLGTDGIIAAIGTVFESVELEYGTPDWMYWFETEEEFNSYVDGNTTLPDTLLALEYPNDWSEEAAQYIADNLGSLVDMVLGLIEIDGVKYASLAELVNAKLDVFNAETINKIIALITDILAEVDDNLLSVGYLLDVDLVGLKNYTCTAEVNDVKSFAAELASILTTYAGGLVDWLFFGDDFRFAKKSDSTDTIVINGGLGYEKGLALVLEALGCDLPEKATVESVLLALANRVDAILGDNMVNEVIDLLPNLIYFLNANGASVAVNNLLAPVYALLDKINGLGILENPIDLAGLLGFDLKYLSLEDILTLVKEKTGLDLAAVEEILVDLCLGKIEKKTYTYKMVVDRKDTVTLILTTALMLVKDEAFAAKLEEMLGTDMISAIKTVFESAPVTYSTPDWYALDGNDVDYDNATVGVIKYAIEYPNNWTEESAKYVAELLESDEFDKLVAGLIDSSYASLGDLLADKVDIYTPALLETIQKALGDLIGGLDESLKDLVNVGLGAADALLGADVQGLLDYDVSGVKDKETFVAAFTGMLMEVEGLVDWLLLGQSYELFVDDKNDNGEYDKGEQIITLNGGHGYAEGLALVLEALGAENLPDVYDMEEIDTEEVVSAVLTAAFDRVDAILADPVAEVFELLPNVLYFINANGLTVAVDNLLGAVNALLIKLEGLGVELDIASLVDFSEILGVETELALDNITMEAVIALVAELTGLNLDKIADVLVGFALGRVAAYDSVSSADITAKMYYHDDFAKYDMITVLATVAIITLTDEANADKVKELLGEDIYQLVLNLINMGEVPVQEFGWLFTDKADTDEVFSVIGAEGIFENFTYGEIYTEEMGQYIADNFGEFVNNVIYLLGIDINGDGQTEAGLTDLINGLLGGSLYNSANVTAIRDALAGVLENITKLEVNGAVVGGIIADVLKTAGIADIKAVADVRVDEFENDREQFVAALCDVLEPLYGILRYVLADEDISFFVNMEKTDAITLRGAEGYAYGIIPLLETLGCENILTPAEYYAAVEADGGVLLTSILDPLLDRVDAILAGDTAQEILNMLTNLIYFVNSNGVDTVVKNTLNAVYGLLAAIEPIAKIDLYELIGIDLAEIDFEWIMDKLFDALAKAGYEFTMEDIDYVASLTVGKLESFTSANGKTAYRMVYAEGEEIGDKKELVTVVLSLIVTFLTHEQNRKVVLDFLRDELCMSDEARPYVQAVFDFIADCINNTQLGTESVLAALYYVYFGVDVGVDNTAAEKKNLDQLWRDALADLRKENNAAADLIEEILGWDIFEDLIDTDGLAPNGFIRFFQKIVDIFRSIIEWFKNLFNRAEPATV
ncbi:MAG: hypothetical protein IKK60_04615 [Clostridia bacterium]|nr:hypothetical protein [Clostridia bacterium]